jgi:hypothetical protein
VVGDLHSTDPDVRDSAYNALDKIYFPASLFPSLLSQVLLTGFPEDSANGPRIQNQLMANLAEIADSNAVASIHYFWPRMAKDKEHLRYELLSIVSGLKTERAFQELPVLLQEHLPRGPSAYLTVANLLDTLSLARGIWKALLPFSGDSLLGPELFRLHRALLDSGFITLDDIRKAFPLMQGALEAYDGQLKKDTYTAFSTAGNAIFDLLGRLDDAPSRVWLRKYLESPNTGGKLHSAVQLTKKGQPVDPKVWALIARDKETRLDLYDELRELNKMDLFPKDYLNRRSFAESHAWLRAEDDYQPKSIHFLREATADLNDKPTSFLLYRITVEDDDGDYSILAIVGPYAPKSRDLLPGDDDDVSGIYEDEEYTPGLEQRHLEAYLKQFAKSR